LKKIIELEKKKIVQKS